MPVRRTAAASALPRIRLRTPAEIVAAVPYLLGFHPEESLVMLGLRGRSRSVCLTLRVDLPPAAARSALAAQVTAHLEHAGATEILLLVATERAAADSGEVELVAAVRTEAAGRRMALSEGLWLRAGRWGSLTCAGPACCPATGQAVDPVAVTELAAVSVVLGDVVYRTREDLAATLLPVGGPEREAVDRCFEWVSRQLMCELARRGWEQVAEDSVLLLGQAIARRVESVVELPAGDVARLALGLADVRVRDQAFRWVNGELAAAAESLWVELTRRATTPYAAAPATLLATHAYLRGNGAYARIALDCALVSDPGYPLAVLLADGLDRGVPPNVLKSALCAVPAA